VLAARHKAALYFFELRWIIQQDDVSIITGWICCCLAALERLVGGTSFFQIKGQKAAVPALQENERFKMEVSFQQQASRDMEAIRIDVKFDQYNFLATISGFPMSLKVGSPESKTGIKADGSGCLDVEATLGNDIGCELDNSVADNGRKFIRLTGQEVLGLSAFVRNFFFIAHTQFTMRPQHLRMSVRF
jgi:hypothetical protein